MSKGAKPRKRFGQHFLRCPATTDDIVAAIAPASGDHIVEIGPGTGALTAPLANHAVHVDAIEFDRDLVGGLRERFADRTNVTVHEADALRFDFGSLGDRLRIVGNLPYNISTPLLFHLLQFTDSIDDMHFMLQKEVVDRMAASPGSRDYGRLTVMLGCHVEIVPLFDVPPSAFDPPPKVTSSVVRLRPLPDDAFDIRNERKLEQIVRQAFSKRRKTLRNALEGVATIADLEAVGLDPGKRPENVPVSGWIALCDQVSG